MGSGISDYNVRRFLKIGFAGTAVLIALLVASSVSWRSGFLNSAQTAEAEKPAGERSQLTNDSAVLK